MERAPKTLLIALDFDGLLIDSYQLLHRTFQHFELDVGDEGRFRNRRKFLKYFGGGRELIGNLTKMALPKKKAIRKKLTETYLQDGRIYPVFVPYLNDCIADAKVHVGIVSRNYTLQPGPTIRHVLAASGVHEEGLDFVIPLSIGAKKTQVLEGMRSSNFEDAIFAGDEISDYHAGIEANYKTVMASFGFDDAKRLRGRTKIVPDDLLSTPEEVVSRLQLLSRAHLQPR